MRKKKEKGREEWKKLRMEKKQSRLHGMAGLPINISLNETDY